MVREGAALGSYVIEGYIASGGMGVVYRAQHRVLRRTVAIKVLQEGFARSPSIRQRFEQEAMVQANLIHPNIVPVTDFVSADGLVALVMEFVAGPSLDQVLEEEQPGPWAESNWLPMFARVVSGVAYAHAAGVVHRDLKPGNVLLDRAAGRPGIPRITDFGIAKLVSGSAPAATRAGSRLGTVPFMAPEQFRGELDVGPAADVFALGMLAWRLATGSLPVNPDDMLAAAELYTGRRVIPSFAAAAPGMATELAEALDACLSLDPGRRPGDAGVLLSILGRPPLGRTADPRGVRAHATHGDSGPTANTSPEPAVAMQADDAIARASQRAAAAKAAAARIASRAAADKAADAREPQTTGSLPEMEPESVPSTARAVQTPSSPSVTTGSEGTRSRHRHPTYVAVGLVAVSFMAIGFLGLDERFAGPLPLQSPPTIDMGALCESAVDHLISLMERDPVMKAGADSLKKDKAKGVEECRKEAKPDELKCIHAAMDFEAAMACDKKAGAEADGR